MSLVQSNTLEIMRIQYWIFANVFFTSAVEVKHSEVLKGTQATISCVVTGLTKVLDAVAWEKPSGDGGGTISDGTDGYKIDKGTYVSSSNSQTTVLTIPDTKNTADAVYTCVITSDEHGKTVQSPEKKVVNSDVFS